MTGSMKHPDQEFVRKTVQKVLSKKRFKEWKLIDVSYVFLPSHYQIKFSNEEKEVMVPIFTEMFDDYESNKSIMTLGKIKREFKSKLLADDSEDGF